jgi:multidrug efflux system membrane fusion protein
VLFSVDEPAFQHIQAARARSEAPIRVQLATAGSPQRYEGTLDYVANTVDAATGTAQVRAIVRNAERRLTDGMFARVEVSLPVGSPRVLVPETALGAAQGSRFVLVATAENTVEHRPVTLGARLAGQRVVESGIQPDDVVLLGGHAWLRPGTPIQPAIQPSRAQAMTVTQH